MKDRSCSCRFPLAVAASTLVLASFAGETRYWQLSGGGDVAIPSNWGVQSIAETDGLAIKNSGTFTMSADVTCDRFVPWEHGLTWTLDFTGHTLTAKGTATPAFAHNVNNFNLTLTGGTVSIPEGGASAIFGLAREAWQADKYNACVTLTGNSTLVETPKTLVNWGSNQWLKVTNGSALKTKELQFGADEVATVSGGKVSCWPDNGIRVDNATLQCTAASAQTLTIGGKFSLRNRFELANNGKLVNFASFQFKGTNSVLEIDNASWTTAGMSYTPIFGAGSLVEVKNGGQLIFGNGPAGASNAGRFWFGSACPYLPNRIRVTGQGSKIKCENTGTSALVGQTGSATNELYVADGGLAEFNDLSVGRGGSNTRVVVAAGGTVTTASGKDVYIGFDGNSGHSSIIVDGGSFTAGNRLFCGYENSVGNALRILNGGTMSIANGLYTASASNGTSRENTIEVANGATLSVDSFAAYGASQRLDVSNATFTVQHRADIPLYGANDEITVTLSGTTPKIKTGVDGDTWVNTISLMSRKATWRFEIPAGGYVSAPIESTSGMIEFSNGGTTLEFDLSGIEDSSHPRTDVPLMKAASGSYINISQAQLDKWLAAEPKLSDGRSCKLVFEKNGVKSTAGSRNPDAIYLRVPGNMGLFVVVK